MEEANIKLVGLFLQFIKKEEDFFRKRANEDIGLIPKKK